MLHAACQGLMLMCHADSRAHAQAKEQLAETRWREDESHAVMTQLHDEAQALAAAHAELRGFLRDRKGELPAGVAGMLGSEVVFDREALVKAYLPKGVGSMDEFQNCGLPGV